MELPPGMPVILFFGFVRPYKGLHLLLNAFKQLLQEGTRARLLIVGEFWDDQQVYLQQIKTLDLQENIQIIDHYVLDDEIAGYFKAVDVFVAPYVGGTQSAVLKTALGFGMPCVATAIIADSFVKTLGERCIIVPTGDAGALARGIAQQLSLKIQGGDQIDALVDSSWQDMLAACAQAVTKPSPCTQKEGEV
jgi:glycosyltransferase involved in cell wall biosynthesis